MTSTTKAASINCPLMCSTKGWPAGMPNPSIYDAKICCVLRSQPTCSRSISASTSFLWTTAWLMKTFDDESALAVFNRLTPAHPADVPCQFFVPPADRRARSRGQPADPADGVQTGSVLPGLGCLGRPMGDGQRHLMLVDSAHILPYK